MIRCLVRWTLLTKSKLSLDYGKGLPKEDIEIMNFPMIFRGWLLVIVQLFW